MTGGEQGDRSAIRVTLSGDAANDVDIDALKKWLERERSLQAWVRDDKLHIHERARIDENDPGTTMGAGMEILLVVIGATSSRLFDEVLAATRAGVIAWRENRRAVESGDPPVAEIEPHAPAIPGGSAPDPESSGTTAPDDEGA